MLRRVGAWLTLAASSQPDIVYKVQPSMPTAEESKLRGEGASLEDNFSKQEEFAAGAQVEASEAKAEVAKAALEIEQMKNSNKVLQHEAKGYAEKAIADGLATVKSAQHTRALMDEVPLLAQWAGRTAADNIVAKARKEMEEDARSTARKADEDWKEMSRNASAAAALAARPFTDAKGRMLSTIRAYSHDAQELAMASNRTQLAAMDLAKHAIKTQLKRLPLNAWREMAEAHDLMDKGQQLKDAAIAYHDTAANLQGSVPVYDLAAGAAFKYAAYQENPGLEPVPGLLPGKLQMPSGTAKSKKSDDKENDAQHKDQDS